MSSSQTTVDKVIAHCSLAGDVSSKKMFGEYGLFLDGKMFGSICDDEFFVKITSISEKLFPDAIQAPPYPGAKPCLTIPPARWAEEEWLSELITETTKLLPVPKRKKSK